MPTDLRSRLRAAAAALSGRVGPETAEPAFVQLSAELMRLADELAALRVDLAAQQKLVTTQTLSVRSDLDAIIRRLYLRPERLRAPFSLWAQRFGLRSQNTEDGLILAILDAADIVEGRFVELGAGTNGGNSGFLAAELGWPGVMVESDHAAAEALRRAYPWPHVEIEEAWITRENVTALVGARGEPTVLSIDIDGNDYWLWEALELRPALVVIEFNPDLGDRAVAVPYDPAFARKEQPGRYFGSSLSAVCRLAETKSYRLVAVEPSSVNAFFLRLDIAPELPAVDPAAVFPPAAKARERFGLEGGKKAQLREARIARLVEIIERHELPLVELDASSERS